jgi:hypothetical protein
VALQTIAVALTGTLLYDDRSLRPLTHCFNPFLDPLRGSRSTLPENTPASRHTKPVAPLDFHHIHPAESQHSSSVQA